MIAPVRVRTALAPFVLVFLAALCLLALVAQADDAGPPPAVAIAAPLDAGVADAGPATKPPAIDAAHLPDPVDDPARSLSMIGDARKTGSMWLAAILTLALLGKAYVRRMAPDPGQAVTGWRAKSVVLVSAALVVLLALADQIIGAGSWAAVGAAMLGLGLAGLDVFNPAKGSKAATPG